MMDDLSILGNLIRCEALADVRGQNDKKIVILEENSGGRGNKYCVKLLNVPGDVIAIKADMFPTPTSIFKNDKEECKRADYVVIINAPTKNWIIYIEMKKGKPKDGREIESQLKGAECFVSYCRAIGRSFWGSKDFLDEEDYQKLFVAVVGIGIDKKPTRQKKSPDKLHDTPENMLKIPAPGKGGLQFNKLIANGKRKP